MKKRNVILQSAIASALMAMAGTASAAVLSTSTISYATEQFVGTGAPSTFVGPSMALQVGTAFSANASLTAVVTLSGATFAAVPASAVGVLGTDAISTGFQWGSSSSVIIIPFTMGAASTAGLGATLFTINTPTLSASALATEGGTVTATTATYIGQQTSATLATATIADTTSTTQTLATSAKGITVTAAANTATARIDLATTTPSINLTAPTASSIDTGVANIFLLGKITATENGKKGQWNGTTAYTFASAPGLSATISSDTAGFFAALGTTGTIKLRSGSAAGSGVACAGPASGTSALYTVAASAAAATSVTVDVAAMGTGVGVLDVCMELPTTRTIAMVSGSTSVTATLGNVAPSATKFISSLASTALQSLASNGQTKYVRNYVPAANVGFTQIVRVSNTGSVDAAVSFSMKSEKGATAGTTGVVIGTWTDPTTLKAGETRRYSQATLETGVGATATTLLSTDRPRITVTAPTDALDVQTLMYSNGVYTSLSGTE